MSLDWEINFLYLVSCDFGLGHPINLNYRTKDS